MPLLIVCVLAWLLTDVARAEAGTDTFRRTSRDTLVHWDADSVQMLVDPELERKLGPRVHAILVEAVRAWDLGGQVPRVDLTLDVSASDRALVREGAVNWIGVADSWTYGDKLAVTVSTYNAQSGAMIAAQVWINPHREFELELDEAGLGATDLYDLQAVLTHELGHVLGLGEAENDPAATMFPTFHRGDTHQRTLSETDEDAIDELYAQISTPRAIPACSSTAPGRAPSTSGPWLLLVFVLLSPSLARRVARLGA